MNRFLTLAGLAVALLVTATAGTQAAHHEEALPDHAESAMAIEISAQVVAVDAEARELVLLLPTGEQVTTTVDAAVQRLDEFAAGDTLVVTYLAALAAELREPTEEELANPWMEGAGAGRAGPDGAPAGAIINAVRAVCTVEGMDRLRGTATILDSRGKVHVIQDVKPERLEQLRIGQTVVMTFTQAVAIGLEKAPSDG